MSSGPVWQEGCGGSACLSLPLALGNEGDAGCLGDTFFVVQGERMLPAPTLDAEPLGPESPPELGRGGGGPVPGTKCEAGSGSRATAPPQPSRKDQLHGDSAGSRAL